MVEEINQYVEGSSIEIPDMMIGMMRRGVNPIAVNQMLNATVMQAPNHNSHEIKFHPLITEDFKI